MNDGVEAGKTSTEWQAAIGIFLTPIVNSLLSKYLGIPPLSESVMIVVIGALTTYIGARTFRKNVAAKSGLADSAAVMEAIKAASAIEDPAARATAMTAVAAKL